jgi:hypothetical protein
VLDPLPTLDHASRKATSTMQNQRPLVSAHSPKKAVKEKKAPAKERKHGYDPIILRSLRYSSSLVYARRME